MSKESVLRFRDEATLAPQEGGYLQALSEYFESSPGTSVEKLENFPKYVPRQKLARFLFKHELFKKVLAVQGSIVECGVLAGGGLMSWAQLSAIYEPVNHQRKIIGFDTFAGYPDIADQDKRASYKHMHKGGLAIDAYEDLRRCVQLYDDNRFLSHIDKVRLIKGDLTKTVPAYLTEYPHTVVSLLYVDVNLYAPSKAAFEQFVPRMPKGAIIVFDALNSDYCPGETLAVMETLGLSNLRIQRLPIDSMPSFAVIE